MDRLQRFMRRFVQKQGPLAPELGRALRRCFWGYGNTRQCSLCNHPEPGARLLRARSAKLGQVCEENSMGEWGGYLDDDTSDRLVREKKQAMSAAVLDDIAFEGAGFPTASICTICLADVEAVLGGPPERESAAEAQLPALLDEFVKTVPPSARALVAGLKPAAWAWVERAPCALCRRDLRVLRCADRAFCAECLDKARAAAVRGLGDDIGR